MRFVVSTTPVSTRQWSLSAGTVETLIYLLTEMGGAKPPLAHALSVPCGNKATGKIPKQAASDNHVAIAASL